MRQSEFFTLKTGRCLIALAILATLAAILFSYQSAASTVVIEHQIPRERRRSRPKRKRGTQTPVIAAPAFTGFKHESHQTDLSCSDCHIIPSREAEDETAAATKPSIKGYPYHDSCVRCHRSGNFSFFDGAKPAICRVCHTRVSPRATARDVYRKFPKQIDLTLRQFPGYFPHDKHCSVISDLPHDKPCSVVSDVSKHADVKQVGCADCHKTDERSPVALLAVAAEQTFGQLAQAFKKSPNLPNDPPSAHASCFGCHWETTDEVKKPSKDNCRGCHRPQQEFKELEQPRKDSLLSLMSTSWFKDWPREWPQRMSAKFSHEGGKGQHARGCLTCHKELMNLKTLDIPDVPIDSCRDCHFSKEPNISDEMDIDDEAIPDEEDDIKQGRNNDPASKEGTHTCSGCHTTLIGSFPPPCSHYRLFREKYLKIEDYPKSAKQIAERCKK